MEEEFDALFKLPLGEFTPARNASRVVIAFIASDHAY